MIQHLVLFQAKPGATDPLLERLHEFCAGAPSQIGGILSASVGKNFNSASQAYSIAAVISFKDREALSVYESHPTHLALAGSIGEMMAGAVVADYEV